MNRVGHRIAKRGPLTRNHDAISEILRACYDLPIGLHHGRFRAVEAVRQEIGEVAVSVLLRREKFIAESNVETEPAGGPELVLRVKREIRPPRHAKDVR